jgi:hypothetical protein
VLTQEVTRLFKKAEQRLRTLTEGGTGSSDEEKVRRNRAKIHVEFKDPIETPIDLLGGLGF